MAKPTKTQNIAKQRGYTGLYGVIRGLYAGLYDIGALLLQCRSTITLSASSHSMGNSHMSFKFSHAWGDANSCSGSLHIDEETHDVREVSPSIS